LSAPLTSGNRFQFERNLRPVSFRSARRERFAVCAFRCGQEVFPAGRPTWHASRVCSPSGGLRFSRAIWKRI